MRVLYLCADFGIPIRGYKGASVHVREMVAGLRALGHEVTVVSPSPGKGNDVAAGVELHHVAQGRLSRAAFDLGRAKAPTSRLPNELRELAYNATLARAGASLLREWRPDVVYERYSLLNLSGLMLARAAGIPHVMEVNAPLRLERGRTNGLSLGRAASGVERLLFGNSDAVLTVSRALREYVIERGGRAERTHVQPNGVDGTRFRPDGDGPRVRARFGISRDAIVMGFCGSLKSWHGTDVLIDAFARVRATHAGARLLVIGEGPEGARLRERATSLGLDSAVVFTGCMDHSEMPDALCAMDIAVAPYRHVPDFYFSPLKIYEYMACGRAVVASSIGEIPELVRDGTTGLLAAPDDASSLAAALGRLCESGALRRRLGDAARAEAGFHDWVVNASTVVRLARELRAREGGALRPVESRGEVR